MISRVVDFVFDQFRRGNKKRTLVALLCWLPPLYFTYIFVRLVFPIMQNDVGEGGGFVILFLIAPFILTSLIYIVGLIIGMIDSNLRKQKSILVSISSPIWCLIIVIILAISPIHFSLPEQNLKVNQNITLEATVVSNGHTVSLLNQVSNGEIYHGGYYTSILYDDVITFRIKNAKNVTHIRTNSGGNCVDPILSVDGNGYAKMKLSDVRGLNGERLNWSDGFAGFQLYTSDKNGSYKDIIGNFNFQIIDIGY